MTKLLTPQAREQLLIDIAQHMMAGSLTEGQALRRLRKDVLAMNQESYAALVKVSRRTLSDIENDLGNQSLSVINNVFKPFGLRLGLLPTSKRLVGQLLNAVQQDQDTEFQNQRLTGFTKQ